MQKLQLTIRRISLITSEGTDQISFCVPNDQVLDQVLGKTEARKLFPELNFEIRITKGKGEDLLKALGLTADEVISIAPIKRLPFKFRENPGSKQKEQEERDN